MTARQHGTYVKYVQDRCRCDNCKAANRDYERQRAARIAPPYVSAQPARDHIAWLATQGVGLKTIAKVSGVAHGALWKIVYGVPSIGRPPSKRIRPETSEKILAVTPADIADGGRVDAAPSWAVLDQLIALGVPKVAIARRLGQTGPGLQLSRNQIQARHARTVTAMKREWEAGEFTYTRRTRHGDQVITLPAQSAEPTHDPDAVERANLAAYRTSLRRGGEHVEPSYDDRDHFTLRLVNVLEDRIDGRNWRSRAACRTQPTWLFFPARGDHTTLAAAKRVCSYCPVRSECLEASIDEPDGVFGGTSAKERRNLRKVRSQAVAS